MVIDRAKCARSATRNAMVEKNPGPFAAPEVFVEAQTLLDGRLLNVHY
jgi:hypothetical protein